MKWKPDLSKILALVLAAPAFVAGSVWADEPAPSVKHVRDLLRKDEQLK